ncbi:hypothetical protein [Salipiger sp. CCB-MM3]|uniref:hypothetical protein n=1 Tax=Salipiger sp. CCB-MM3 TaxID=1792508 RepID=UPI0012FC62BF|nr:hypothetical protein [Salipiger sp. CCB-MM3]
MAKITFSYDEDDVRALIAADVEKRYGHTAKAYDVERDEGGTSTWSISVEDQSASGRAISIKLREKPKLGAKLLAARKRVFGRRQSPMAYNADTIPRISHFYFSDLMESEAWKGSQ